MEVLSLFSSSSHVNGPLSGTTLSYISPSLSGPTPSSTSRPGSFVYHITGDGNCLFRALSYGLYGLQEEHALVRNRIVTHVANNWTYYSSLVIGDTSYGVSIKSVNDYTNHMSKNGIHGGHLELTVASSIFNIFINLHHSNDQSIMHFGSDGGRKKRVSLLYTGDGDNGHYDVVAVGKNEWNRLRNLENNKRYRGKGKGISECNLTKLDHVAVDKKDWNRLRNRENNKRYRAKRKAISECNLTKLNHAVDNDVDNRETSVNTNEYKNDLSISNHAGDDDFDKQESKKRRSMGESKEKNYSESEKQTKQKVYNTRYREEKKTSITEGIENNTETEIEDMKRSQSKQQVVDKRKTMLIGENFPKTVEDEQKRIKHRERQRRYRANRQEHCTNLNREQQRRYRRNNAEHSTAANRERQRRYREQRRDELLLQRRERNNRTRIQRENTYGENAPDNIEPLLIGVPSVKCNHCGALSFQLESGRPKNNCCHGGKLQYSYPSHTLALTGPAAGPNQPAFQDPHLSVVLSETRTQNAELRKLDRSPQQQQPQQQQSGDLCATFEWREKEEKFERELTESKLTARIAAEEEKCKILERENVTLKKDLEDASVKLVSMQNNKPAEIAEAVKSAMNSVYSLLQPEFSNGVAYEGLVVRKTLAATIREVTLQFINTSTVERDESDPHKGGIVKEMPTLQRNTNKPELVAKPDGQKILLRKESSIKIEVDASASATHHLDTERNVGNGATGHKESSKHTDEEATRLMESTVTVQDGNEFKVKEEIHSSGSSREGSLERVNPINT